MSPVSNIHETGSSNGNNGCTIHVSKLNPKTREADLNEKFAPYGKILDCIILIDPNTKLSRGFGFITFAKPEEANDAITNLNKTRIDGAVIEIQIAKRSSARDPTPGRYMGSDKKRSLGYQYPPGRGERPPYGYYAPPQYPPTKYPMNPYPYGYNYGSYPPPPPPQYSSYPSYPPHKSYDRYSPYVRHDSGSGSNRDSRRSSSSDDRDRREDRDSRRGSSSDDRDYFSSRGRESSHH